MMPAAYLLSRPVAPGAAFTLLELLVSMTVLVLIVSVIAGMANSATRAWSNGEQTVENYQTGRALLEMIGREVSEAAISPKLQFVDSPVLPSTAKQRPSSSIFWLAPLSSTNGGDLCEVGYYLTTSFELKRFFVPPSDTADYRIFTTGYTPLATGNYPGSPMDHAQAALWATSFVSNADISGRPLSTTVASCVLNFYVRCLDINGDPIPWLDTRLRYNSAEPAQPTMPGLRNTSSANQGNPSSFNYTYYNAANTADPLNTAPGNLLPYAVEVTLVTTDLQSLQRLGTAAVPGTPAVDNVFLQRSAIPPYVLPGPPLTIPGSIATFMRNVQNAGFRNARSFSTVVRLRNAAP